MCVKEHGPVISIYASHTVSFCCGNKNRFTAVEKLWLLIINTWNRKKSPREGKFFGFLSFWGYCCSEENIFLQKNIEK
jgi:hypothetical protein